MFATGKNTAFYADSNGKPFYYRTSGGRNSVHQEL